MNKFSQLLWLTTLFVLGIGAISTPQIARGADPFTDFFNRDCVPEAKKSGLTQKEATQGCTCTINALRKKYSSPAFNSLLSKYRSGDTAARRTLRSFGEPCFDEILDDILFEE